MIDYIRDGQAIYRQSFATIRAEANLAGIPADLEKLAVRVIHACGMVDVVDDLRFSPGAGVAGRAALAAGAAILCDARMVAEGVTRSRLPAANRVICPQRSGRAGARHGTRQYPLGGGPGALARAPGGRRGGDRQRADRAVLPAGNARRQRRNRR